MTTVFDDLVGQEPAVAILQGASLAARTGEETQEMTHAWIFTGRFRPSSHLPTRWMWNVQ
jgi:DNA polymerase-3 subunit delta'